MQHTSDILSGKPHQLEILTPLIALPWTIPALYLLNNRFVSLQFIVISATATIISFAFLIISIRRRSKSFWSIKYNTLHFSRGIFKKHDTSIRLDRISCTEMLGNPVYSIFGGTRVNLYSSTSPRPVFSMIMPKKQASELINRTALSLGTNNSEKPRYLVQKKYAALLSALTSLGTVIPLGISIILCIFGFGQAELYIIAAALWILAVMHTILCVSAECRISVCRVNSGYAVQTGLSGSRKVFIPDQAIIGVSETRNPIATFAGAGKFELLCSGGKRITCINWYDNGHPVEVASQMIGCKSKSFAKISAPRILKRRYFTQLVLCIASSIALWRIIAAVPTSMRGICASLSVGIITAGIIHCITALKCTSDFGVTLSCDTVRVCSMKFMFAQRLTLRRGETAFVSSKQTFVDRLQNTCSASFSPKGRIQGITCHNLPYERFQAAAVRIISRSNK